jgi:nicotinate phosphoribosyltransferase
MSALGLGLDAFVTVSAAAAAGVANSRAAFEFSLWPGQPDWGFLVLAGIDPLIAAIERLNIRRDELDWLESVGAIHAEARALLTDAKFVCDVDAAPEGSVIFAGEPVVSVEGPYWQTQLVAALVEAALTEATLVATFFARMRLASGGVMAIVDRGPASARRMGGAPRLARAAFIGGAAATTNALAGRRYGIPVLSTQPPSFQLAPADAGSSMQAWIGVNADIGILRLDSGQATGTALRAIAQFVRSSKLVRPIAIELPADDLSGAAREAVRAFREVGLPGPRLFVSGPIDERTALELRHADTAIHGIVVASDIPRGIECVGHYNLVAIEEGGRWVPRSSMRHSAIAPGRKLVIRYVDGGDRPVADVAHSMNERILQAQGGTFVDIRTERPARISGASGTPLRAAAMRGGKRVSQEDPVTVVRDRAHHSVAGLAEGYKKLVSPAPYPLGITAQLDELRRDLRDHGGRA